MSPETSKTALVSIVGAGPGDPDLITVKGLKAIESADVILYDALASPELLQYAKPSCEKIYVGKRKGSKEYEQEEINAMLVEFGSQSKRVVRLKGGDSYVFGRGHEELEFLVRKGISAEVIPGITSAMAGPATVGIPVTKRGVNESFMVVTGMLSDGQLSKDIVYAAQSTATIIVLMGMTHLSEIVKTIKQYRSAEEPMAVIQHATTKVQQYAMGNANTILDLVQNKGLDSPAVIVIGNVVKEGVMMEELIQQFLKNNS